MIATAGCSSAGAGGGARSGPHLQARVVVVEVGDLLLVVERRLLLVRLRRAHVRVSGIRRARGTFPALPQDGDSPASAAGRCGAGRCGRGRWRTSGTMIMRDSIGVLPARMASVTASSRFAESESLGDESGSICTRAPS